LALNNKVGFKESIAEDAEREKSVLQKENIKLQKKIDELKNLNSVIEMIEKNEQKSEPVLGVPNSGGVGASVRWAS
jgi:hypothetical protein